MTKKKNQPGSELPRITEDENTSILEVQSVVTPVGHSAQDPAAPNEADSDTQVSRLESVLTGAASRPKRSMPPPERRPMRTSSLDGDRVLAGATAVIRLADIEARGREKAPVSAPSTEVVPGRPEARRLPPPPPPPREPEETGPLTDLESINLAPVATGVVAASPAAGPRKLAFFGPKGGVGATAVSANVAGVLAKLGSTSVIVDMDLQLGAVPVSLGVVPQRSISELVVAAEADPDSIRGEQLDYHTSGVAVVAQGEIDDLDQITAQRVPRFFDCLAKEFDYVIIDGLRDFSDLAMVCLDASDLIVVVFTQDVPAVRAVIRSLELFAKLGYPTNQIRLVLNRYQKKSPVSLDAIARALGRNVDCIIHNNFPLVERGFNQGRFVYELEPASPVAEDLEVLTRSVVGLPATPKKQGLFSKLFRR